ncbi:hypothetical protein RJ639_029087 [Escallonia herrerae]|uniref:Uncharacterized protein n=1 Tax=Escallonia herrerae TaxID=1293975 RepID=A0AA88X6R0_9ASTE|nr:hypothetical protein RJ639_029087 [Escallonia herrerae]
MEWSFVVDPVEGWKFEDLVKGYEEWLKGIANKMEEDVVGKIKAEKEPSVVGAISAEDFSFGDWVLPCARRLRWINPADWGSTVIGVVAAVTSSSNIDSNTIKLWHIGLLHMSERGIDELSKQGYAR